MFSSALFLIFVGLLLPLACWRSYRNIVTSTATVDDLPSSTAIAVQALIIHGIGFGLALACAHYNSLELLWFSEPRPLAVLAALGILTGTICFALWEARRPTGNDDGLRVKLRGEGITVPSVITVITAAVVEEYVYRGVLYLFLALFIDPLLAAVISAIAFGLAHFGQGWRGVLISAGFGLAMQFLYYLSGALMLAVGTHLLYDLGILWMVHRRARLRGHSGAVS